MHVQVHGVDLQKALIPPVCEPRGRQTLVAIALWVCGGVIYLAWYNRHWIIDSINLFWVPAMLLVAFMVACLCRYLVPRRASAAERQ